MQESKIFVAGHDPLNLHPMVETPYAAEVFLQKVLANNPDMIPGDQINPEYPRRWMLVHQETGIPSEKDGGNCWRLDHIFVDQEGIPTFIECKRSSDPRLRREVVAQMLDYAANATEYWPKGKLKELTKETAHKNKRDMTEELRNLLRQEDMLLEDNLSEEWENNFWDIVDSNLSMRKIRLLFVADHIPRELRRLVEFLNSEMANIETLAIEIKQHTNENNEFKVFVSRVIGLTEDIQRKKSTSKKRFGSIEEQLEIFPQNEIFKKVVQMVRENDHQIGTGITNFSIKRVIDNKLVAYAFGRQDGPSLQISTEFMKDHPDLTAQLEELLDKRGSFRKGKCTITIPVNDNAADICDHMIAIIGIIDNYAARFES